MKFIILGGGLSGLAAGYKLSKKGNEVVILEKEDFLGGLASTYDVKWENKNFEYLRLITTFLLGIKPQ